MDVNTTIQDLKKQMEELKQSNENNQLAMVVFSGELDKLLAAFIIATGVPRHSEKRNSRPREKIFLVKCSGSCCQRVPPG